MAIDQIDNKETLDSTTGIKSNGNGAGQKTVLICRGPCQSGQAPKIHDYIEKEMARRGLSDQVQVKTTGCHGFCQQGPTVMIEPEGVLYVKVDSEDAPEIVDSHILGGKLIDRLLYVDPISGQRVPYYNDILFYHSQQRIVLQNCGKIDPENIDEYLAGGGYQALRKALLEMTSEQVRTEVKKSGLRGRGGAGFSTGTKWDFCAASPGPVKYMICNADEGDPGAFMDRGTMEGDPHAVLEGLMIGGYAIGAPYGYIYCRAEYPLALRRMRIAIKQAEERGYLGENIFGTNFTFHVEIKEGAGAFVCGEETALMASIEGKRGMPRARPPFPAVAGLWGKPSNINNVETLASISTIILKGGDWYASIGTEKSKGTKVFALTGTIANSGLVEVPMGIKLRDIIFEIGGGIPKGKRFKAAQTGGPIGGCLPSSLLDLSIDYESLSAEGALMGSGGLVVMDEDNCMVDVAKFFLSFAQSESCGKCIPCRVGTKQMLDILEDITCGRGKMEDLDLLEELAKTVSAGSLCALGGGAPNPVVSTLKHFRSEYEAHIKKHKCPAAVCKGLVSSPCTHTCPAGIDIPRYIRCISAGDFEGALGVILESNPLPTICGRVCFHPCEVKCRRGQMDEPVAINALKRFVTERAADLELRTAVAGKPTGKKVAVVGSGPAGLTVAYYLGRKGHSVTIFEALPEPGGMLRVGIPEYRLPKELLEWEIGRIRKLGVEIKTNTRIESVEQLFKEGFDSVFLGLGAHKGMKMGVAGEDNPHVIDCASYLRDVALGKKFDLGARVVVVGGGNAAIDAARTSKRLGAKSVTMVYRRTRQEMPALDTEIDEALHEGVDMRFLANPTRIVADGQRLKVECIRMKLGPTDNSGRRRPEPIPGSEFAVEADTVIAAIGQASDVPAAMNLPVARGGVIQVDPDSLEAHRSGVFAAGDIVLGPSSVIESIGQGKEAAIAIDRYLGGDGNIKEVIAPPEAGQKRLGASEEEAGARRYHMPCLADAQRLSSFGEVELGFDEETAIAEARRCLECDLEE
ncbi:MAG: FAD-dependent oxidoreductase [Chloroflexi bacterium]|nr:FAD-dependent oxidoreductase [Chloroflexota bacterium]